MAKKTGVELEFSILDEDFKKAIKEMNSSIASMKKELNLENEVLKSSNASITDYQNKLNTLKQQQEISKNKVQEATAVYEKAKGMLGENSKEASKYKDTLIIAQMEQQRITNEIEETTKSLEEHESALKEDEQKNRELNSTLGSLTSTINEQKGHLEDLKRQYVNTVLEQGKGSDQAKTLKEEIKNLSSEIKSSETRLNNAENELKEFSDAEDKAGKHAITFGEMIKANLISDVIKKGISEIANGVKQLGSFLLDTGKQAFESFGEYEQLIGGVDTLFKDSSSQVQEYANNAYKTSGLSANKYMETVTSFSASLLQSLDGDTKKAAEVADMAITDMSDNANKMGTDMSMIQSAYQGFAKQNYTMLDNLKLGYGGTKTEMERLLADAEKVTGIKYDINNLNDVYQAIHVIQTELNISGLSYEQAMEKVANGEMTLEEATNAMGTTAKEASTTIQGSIASMKSAWSNLLTGFGNDQADLGLLVNNLFSSISTVLDNSLPIVETIVNNLVKASPQIFETGGQLLTKLLEGITNNIPMLSDVAIVIMTGLVNTTLSNLPMILQAGMDLLVELTKGIAQASPQLVPTIVNVILEMVNVLTNPDNLMNIVEAALILISSLAEGLINAIPVIVDNLPKIIMAIVNGLLQILPKLVIVGSQMIAQLGAALVENTPKVVSKVSQIVTSVINGFGNMVNSALDIGKNFVTGLWNGINNAKDWIIGKIKGFKDSVLNGIKSFFGIHSPSTVFRDEVGKNLALGVGLGFSDEMVEVAEEMQNSIPSSFDVGVNTNTVTNGYSSNDIVRNITDTSDYNPGQVSPIYITIENFNNNREQDIEDLSEELEFYRSRINYGKGNA